MKKTLDVHDYYFGVIIATPEYLKSSKRVRMLNGFNYDPFCDSSDTEALIFGVPTLLKKETKDGEDFYIDQYHSRYKNEISYQLNNPNHLGLVLAFVKPFTDYYTESPTWYLEEDIINNDLFYQIYMKHTYYISYSKSQNSEAVVALRDYEEAILDEYLIHLLGDEMYCKITGQSKNVVKEKK